MSDQPQDSRETEKDQVPGGGLSGNEEGASSDGDSGPEGAGAAPSGEAREDEAQQG
jgi:hypothetical protein